MEWLKSFTVQVVIFIILEIKLTSLDFSLSLLYFFLFLVLNQQTVILNVHNKILPGLFCKLLFLFALQKRVCPFNKHSNITLNKRKQKVMIF